MNFIDFFYDYVLIYALVAATFLAALWAIYTMIFGKSVPRRLNFLAWRMNGSASSQEDTARASKLHEDEQIPLRISNSNRASNKVLAGDYIGWTISGKILYGYDKDGKIGSVHLSKETVYRFDFLKKRLTNRKMLRTLIDTKISRDLFGDIGAFHAYMNAERHAIFYALIIFKDGKQSALELSEKNYYRLSKLLS